MWDIQPTNCISAGYSRNTNVVMVRITFGMASRVDAAAAAFLFLGLQFVAQRLRPGHQRAVNAGPGDTGGVRAITVL